MDVNFKLILPGAQSDISADKINWVTWKTDGGGGFSSSHDGPDIGRCLVLDLEVMPLAVLLELSKNNFENLDGLLQKSAYAYLSMPIISMEEVTRENIKFTTQEGEFELLINANPILRTRTPFSYT